MLIIDVIGMSCMTNNHNWRLVISPIFDLIRHAGASFNHINFKSSFYGTKKREGGDQGEEEEVAGSSTVGGSGQNEENHIFGWGVLLVSL